MREKLKNFNAIENETKQLKKQIRDVQNEIKVHNTVKGSYPDFSYIERSIRLYGLGDNPTKNQKIIAYKKQIEYLKQKQNDVLDF